MTRIAKIILGSVAGLGSLLILALIGINLYLQSGDVQSRVRLATEQAFGSPVEIRRTLYTPWSGLVLSGLSVADPVIPDAKMVQAAGFSVRFEFLPLLRNRLVISQISLNEPHFALRQNAEGQWVFQPPRPEVPPRDLAERPAPPVDRPPAPTDREAPAAGKPRAPAYTVELRQFSVRHGSALLTDRRGRPVLRLDGLRIDGTMAADGQLEGELHVDELIIADRLRPRKLRAIFSHSGEQLNVTDIKSAFADGALRGEIYGVFPRRGDAQFDLRLRVDDVSIPVLIEEAHGDTADAAGTLQGDFRLKGNPGDETTFTGAGQLSLIEAKLRPLDFIRQIGNVLRVDELQMLDLERSDLRFDVRDKRVWINTLHLETENLIITAEGPVKFNGDMELDGRLLVNEKIQKQLRGLLNENFTASENAGYKQLEFLIGGKVSRPQTDLADRVIGVKVGQYLGGFLKGVFNAPEPRKDDDKNSDDDDDKKKPGAKSSPDSSRRDARQTPGSQPESGA